jgi:hypothetical protein
VRQFERQIDQQTDQTSEIDALRSLRSRASRQPYAENRLHGIADLLNTELRGVLAGGLNGGILCSLEVFVLRGVPTGEGVEGDLRPFPSQPKLTMR